MSDSRTILLVDDEQQILRGTNLRLRAAGYRTMQARDGADGLAAAIEERPDAIVLDVRMPRMDGLSALVRLKERDDTRHIPVIMLSASVVDQQAALEAGARFFLNKPFQSDLLLTAISSALGRSPHSGGTNDS